MSEQQSYPAAAYGQDPSLQIVIALQNLTTQVGQILQAQLKAALVPAAYAVAGLPVGAQVGTLAFASNARTAGEAAGAGTGALVQVASSGVWQVVGTGLAPTY